MTRRDWLGLILLGGTAARLRAADSPPLGAPGTLLLLRHAEAPGTGDPVGFRLGDCSTQRNLSAAGRQQARELGARLREAGLGSATPVRTSPWCRCRDTATLLGLGPPEVLDPLASFFGDPAQAEPLVNALRDHLAALPIDGAARVYVTHQVTITALTGIFPGSGEGAVLRLNGTCNPGLLGRLTNTGIA